eukprot:COSAG02_NODE_5619_length_4178_cov_2.972297_3_plen_80_part_00
MESADMLIPHDNIGESSMESKGPEGGPGGVSDGLTPAPTPFSFGAPTPTPTPFSFGAPTPTPTPDLSGKRSSEWVFSER